MQLNLSSGIERFTRTASLSGYCQSASGLEAPEKCQSYGTSNTAGLSAKRVHAFVTGIHLNSGDNTVRVDVSADLLVLFPSGVPGGTRLADRHGKTTRASFVGWRLLLITQNERNALIFFELSILQKHNSPLFAQHCFNDFIYCVINDIGPGNVVRRQ